MVLKKINMVVPSNLLAQLVESITAIMCFMGDPAKTAPQNIIFHHCTMCPNDGNMEKIYNSTKFQDINMRFSGYLSLSPPR